jgi:hypothetical protein
MFVYAAYAQTEDGDRVLAPIYGGSPCSGTSKVSYFEDEVKEVNMLDTVRNAGLQVGMPTTGEATHDVIAILVVAAMCVAGGLLVRRYLVRWTAM